MKTILVIDDEFDLASTLRAILEGDGYRVETCSNGREALERLRGGPRPDLVLTDVMMPLVSGFEVLHTMRQTDGLKEVPWTAARLRSRRPSSVFSGAQWE